MTEEIITPKNQFLWMFPHSDDANFNDTALNRWISSSATYFILQNENVNYKLNL
jgi:hypothetical protein